MGPNPLESPQTSQARQAPPGRALRSFGGLGASQVLAAWTRSDFQLVLLAGTEENTEALKDAPLNSNADCCSLCGPGQVPNLCPCKQ